MDARPDQGGLFPWNLTRVGNISKAAVTFKVNDGKHESKATIFDSYGATMTTSCLHGRMQIQRDRIYSSASRSTGSLSLGVLLY
jgi:hypothetical protein